ncbi:pyridine nucleotide-disulfide oxidoreductase [Niastella yeongjuensis]|uniref:Pyridine nucleotide-disulfide oxidoreductase n=1 Tax=Niastella yeongjuensis TaxID=354355 RepID=A0A1V9EF42_9BACT|nr:NAD(P)/FAD-dependent oxidoreductase [Niastella yeongjuensis]OQP44545.1 pyridine nucleotide-disulfide oxidoreductase [Niastella yeongjuensis]SEO83971.1 Thioredoxin reductase [Niastella yeongjuensis]
MAGNNRYDVVIVGGSYAGLSAAMSLGRSLRNVLIIDSGLPCNRQTPHSHNFITHDGETPKAIAEKAREQVLKYKTVSIQPGLAVSAVKKEDGFELTTADGTRFFARKLLFATGVKDLMPAIPGFAECWGITVIHCPYCHGYEVKQEKTGIMSNGDIGFEFSKLIANLTPDLTLFTNGKSTLSLEQLEKLQKHKITVVETEIAGFEHSNGQLKQVLLKDGSTMPLKAMYAKIPFIQHCDIPVQLGCTLTEQGYLAVDMLGRTSVPGVYAAGDNTAMMRAVSLAVAGGGMAGAGINKELVEESF